MPSWAQSCHGNSGGQSTQGVTHDLTPKCRMWQTHCYMGSLLDREMHLTTLGQSRQMSEGSFTRKLWCTATCRCLLHSSALCSEYCAACRMNDIALKGIQLMKALHRAVRLSF